MHLLTGAEGLSYVVPLPEKKGPPGDKPMAADSDRSGMEAWLRRLLGLDPTAELPQTPPPPARPAPPPPSALGSTSTESTRTPPLDAETVLHTADLRHYGYRRHSEDDPPVSQPPPETSGRSLSAADVAAIAAAIASVIGHVFTIKNAICAALLAAAEYALLSLIEEAPRAIKFATLVAPVLMFLAIQFETNIRKLNRDLFPAVLAILFLGYLGFGAYVFFLNPELNRHSQPEFTQQQVDAKIAAALEADRAKRPAPAIVHDPPTAEEIEKATAPIRAQLQKIQQEKDDVQAAIKALKAKTGQPALPEHTKRSKQEIAELLGESGEMLKIVEGVGMQLLSRWQSLSASDPALICLDLDSHKLRDSIRDLISGLNDADDKLLGIIRQNSLDADSLRPLLDIGGSMTNRSRFAAAANFLHGYENTLSQLGDHPKCEIVIGSNLFQQFVYFDRELQMFSIWLAQTQDRLTAFRNELRMESRNAP
jgi:hypothetical protein